MTQVVALAGETDFDGWRRAARALRRAGVKPEAVSWSPAGDLFEAPLAAADTGPAFNTPAAFLDLARDVVLHRSPDRFALLYRLLWRLADQPHLLALHSDPDVQAAAAMRKAVSLASHKMKAFVRFRQAAGGERETYLAWYEPPHRIVERTAPFFVRRFTALAFSLLTPDRCAHWNGADLTFSEGVDRAFAPDGDILEDLWLTYYGSIFNPARLKVKAMEKEMPKRYWRNLPEARLIPQLIEDAPSRAREMVHSPPTQPRRRIRASDIGPTPVVEAGDASAPPSLEVLAKRIQGCRRCDLWRDATQAVAGEGPSTARLMLVGEQPGDQEDLSGRAFVGPAGQVLDRALKEAGIHRADCYVTNAVKHFKHEPRGKRRLHKTPDRGEVQACRWWLDHERRLVRPRVIVTLGATAASAVFGKAVPVLRSRGQSFPLDAHTQGFVTIHPSYLLRIPDAEAKAAGMARFIADLRAAKAAAG